MNKVNKDKNIVIRNESLEKFAKDTTDVNPNNLIDKKFKEIGNEKIKIDKSDEDLRMIIKRKKFWELEEVLWEVKSWFQWEVTEHELYQKEGKFFYLDELYHYSNKTYNYDLEKEEWKKLQVANCIKKGIKDPFRYNEKTEQLENDLAPLSECSCCSLTGCECGKNSKAPHEGWCQYKKWNHIVNCLKTNEEIEEFCQKIIRNLKEALREIERMVLEEKGVVWEYKDQQVDDYFWDRSIQKKYRLVQSFDEIPQPCCDGKSHCKPSSYNEKSVDLIKKGIEEWVEQKKLITERIKKQSAKELICKQQVDDQDKNTNNSKIILDKKKDNSNIDKSTKSENNNYLISVGLTIAVISAVFLATSFAVWMVKKQKNLKKVKE